MNTAPAATETDLVTLWLVDGRPVRAVIDGERWQVTDRPTPLLRDSDWVIPFVSHQPEVLMGWRFQARSAAGIVRVLDVVRDGEAWRLVHAWH